MEICILKPLKLCWSLAEGSTVWGRQPHERIHLGQLRTSQQLVINSTSVPATMLEGSGILKPIHWVVWQNISQQLSIPIAN